MISITLVALHMGALVDDAKEYQSTQTGSKSFLDLKTPGSPKFPDFSQKQRMNLI
ncbi:MAG TPA: hypothetical protein IGS53_13590 [Leptolyngbyaceae cyanobacterium M33_DOE_097]|nr:hypothetical protein [Leptolyngbyaceae cyanobacterium M33_DOE_097]